MTNQDKKKGCLSGIFFIFSFVFPVISLIIGWIGGGWKAGTIAGLVTFSLFFLLGAIFAMWIQSPSWFTIMLPTIAGLAYGILPDFIPLKFDDVLVAAAGAIISFTLASRKYSDMPKWTLVPLLAAALYTVVGPIIPGPVDELIVGFIAIGVTGREIYKLQSAPKNEALLPESNENSGDVAVSAG